MFSLPSLAPQDSYSLWYTSSSTPHPPAYTDPSHSVGPGQNPTRRTHTQHRTPLARLRLDEEYQSRRLLNISNFGASWIKPPGMPKSLHQVREEEREMKEHQEAMRREALAQELAEAEAQGIEEMMGGEELEELQEARDLDDDVPDADGTGLDSDDDDDDDEDEDEDEDGDEENGQLEAPRILQPQIPPDVYREALARGQDIRAGQYIDGASMLEDEENSGILQEEDLVHDELQDENGDLMGMGVDLDAGVPDADGYEHTDTEDELTSSDEESDEGRLPQHGASMVRSDGTQNSMDLRSLASGHSSMGASSSPRLRRPPRS